MSVRLHGKDPNLGIERLASENEEFTQWVAYTPTGSWIANTTYAGYYRVIGDTLESKVEVNLSGPPTSTTLRLDLPTDYTVKTSMLPTSRETPTGYATLTTTGISYFGISLWDNGASTQIRIHYADGSGSNVVSSTVTQSMPFLWGSGDSLDIYYSIPVDKM